MWSSYFLYFLGRDRQKVHSTFFSSFKYRWYSIIIPFLNFSLLLFFAFLYTSARVAVGCANTLLAFLHSLEFILGNQADFLVRHSLRELVFIGLLNRRPDWLLCLDTYAQVRKRLLAQELLVSHMAPQYVCVTCELNSWSSGILNIFYFLPTR